MQLPRIVLLLIVFSLAFASTEADEPNTVRRDTAVVERLDSILKRLNEIEARLSNVEADLRPITDWSIDDLGVMRLPSGRAIGFWGIDGATTIRAADRRR